MKNIRERVEKILVDNYLILEDQSITDESNLYDLGLDSLDVVEFIMFVEREFDISIPDEKAENILTVGELVSYIENWT